jgi:hypothetical protein
VLGVAVLTVAGFASYSTPALVAALVLTVPASVVTLPAFYVLYGLVSQIPGANPLHSSGSGLSSDGSVIVVTSGMPAPWLAPTMHTLGVLLITLGAVLNVLLARAVLARRKSGED